VNAPRDIAAAPAVMEAYFHDLAGVLDQSLAAGEAYTARFSAEASDFVRMNRGKVRQPGAVVQHYLTIELIRGKRHASHQLSLSGEPAADRESLRAIVSGLRAIVPDLDDDPHLMIATDVESTRSARGEPLPPAEAVIDAVLGAGAGLDLVGLYAGGPMYRGFANSFGQRNWHEATTFNLQWSLYHRADKAVKSALSGFSWDPSALVARMNEAREQLAHIAMPATTLPPGKYRAYLTPAAMEEIERCCAGAASSARARDQAGQPLADAGWRAARLPRDDRRGHRRRRRTRIPG
jgi:predicted Zn-dependent protease